METTNPTLSEEHQKALNGRALPDVILVRKTYPERAASRAQRRRFELRQIAKEQEERNGKASKKTAIAAKERDYEHFMQELEEDVDMRSRVNLYPVGSARAEAAAKEVASASASAQAAAAAAAAASASSASSADAAIGNDGDDDDEDGDGFPEISMVSLGEISYAVQHSRIAPILIFLKCLLISLPFTFLSVYYFTGRAGGHHGDD
jgi:nonsense-mediated mRNA decay protein 3